MTLNELKNYRSYWSEREEIKRKLKSSASEESSTWLLYRYKELEDKMIAILRFVNNIMDSDYKIYRALRIYCIEPLDEDAKAIDWEDVACRIGNGCTESAIRKAVSRYFKKI